MINGKEINNIISQMDLISDIYQIDKLTMMIRNYGLKIEETLLVDLRVVLVWNLGNFAVD